MMRLTVDDARVVDIYEWYRDAMASAGIKVPAYNEDTLPKTYLFRSLRKFANKALCDWSLDDVTTRQIIASAVKLAKTRGVINRGGGFLLMDSVLNGAISNIAQRTEVRKALIPQIKHNAEFISGLGVSQDDIHDSLVRPLKYGGYPAIVSYYQAGKLRDPYLAVSRLCRKVLNSLPLSDRIELPKDLDLHMARIRILSDMETRNELRQILGTDLLGL